MHFSGDMKPIALVTGTTLNIGTEVVLSPVVEISVGRLLKPMFYVIASSDPSATGSMVLTYTERIADLPALRSTEITVTLTEIDGAYYGVYPITTDYSTLGLSKYENGLDDILMSFEIGITGLIMYE